VTTKHIREFQMQESPSRTAFLRWFAAWSVSRFQQCLLANDSRALAASAVMPAAAVTAGVTPSAVRMPPAEILTAAAVEALRRMPTAHVEAA